MAQGTIKKSKPTPTSTRRPTILGPKKGARAIAPRKAVLVKQKKLTKKHSAGLINKTERTLAGKVGHLELLEGGKRGSKDKGVDKKAKGKGSGEGGKKS